MPGGFSRSLRRAGALAVALGGAGLALPSIAAANPACGKVVTHNVTLSASMNCPNSTGLYVGNNGITINLNGFTISSNFSFPSAGIDNAGDWPASAPGSGGTSGPGTGFNRDTVENGNVAAFYTNIYGVDTTGMNVSNVNSYGGEYGLSMKDSYKPTVTGSHFGNQTNPNSYGAVMDSNAAENISDDTFNHNEAVGFYDQYSQGTLNGVKANFNPYEDGVYIDAPVAPYLVENSKANGNGGTGFETENNNFNTITFNNNNAENNGGWGYFAESFANGTNNGFENDSSGGCHNVGGCHLNP